MAKEKRLIATLDFETDPFKYGRDPEPFCAGLAVEDGSYHRFWGADCNEQIADFVADEKLRIYAHNGGKFDYFFMLKYLSMKMMLINGRISKARLGKSVLVDSYLIFPMALRELNKDEIDYSIMEREERNKPENKKEILAYLRSDCEYLLKWVLKFNERFGVKLTVAAAAFGELEKTGYPCKKPSSEKYDDIFRSYYYGGRTQNFKSGVVEGTYEIWDINSAYPEAMKQKHPYGTDYNIIDGSEISVDQLISLDEFYFVTLIGVTSGCLPFKDLLDPKKPIQYYDDDIPREYNTTKWEVMAGIETKTLKIIEVKKVLIHTKTKNFCEYIDKFYKEKVEGKKENDPYKTRFAKLMLVSAYGKFGSDGRKYKESALVDDGELPVSDDQLIEAAKEGLSPEELIENLKWTIDSNTEFSKVLWTRPDPVADFYNVAVAASVAGCVRAKLWKCIHASENVAYCDTDSIFTTNFKGGEKDPHKLGAWDFEGRVKKDKDGKGRLYIGGRKLYTCELEETDDDGNHIIKKANKGARLTHEQIKDIVETGKEFEWLNDAPSFSLSRGIRYVKRNIKCT